MNAAVGMLAQHGLSEGDPRPSRDARAESGPGLVARGIVKRFGHVRALRGADLDVRPGEVVGLVGDNGAGKSTLIKALTGAIRPDSGTVELDGRPVAIGSAGRARDLGIEVVHQDLALAPDLDAVANLFLGRELYAPGRRWLGTLDRRTMRRRAGEVFELTGVRLPGLDRPVRALSGGQRQIVAVVRAVAFARRLIFMDEPTSALGVTQTELVAGLIRAAADRGVAVVLISHNLPELSTIADRIVVLRLGRTVARFDAPTVGPAELLEAMTGLRR